MPCSYLMSSWALGCQSGLPAKPEQLLKTAVSPQVNTIKLGVPVRLIRKNKDKGSEFGSVYIYDGLYDVVRLSAGIHQLDSTHAKQHA